MPLWGGGCVINQSISPLPLSDVQRASLNVPRESPNVQGRPLMCNVIAPLAYSACFKALLSPPDCTQPVNRNREFFLSKWLIACLIKLVTPPLRRSRPILMFKPPWIRIGDDESSTRLGQTLLEGSFCRIRHHVVVLRRRGFFGALLKCHLPSICPPVFDSQDRGSGWMTYPMLLAAAGCAGSTCLPRFGSLGVHANNQVMGVSARWSS